MSGEVAANFESFRRRGVRRYLAVTVIAGSGVLGACSAQSASAPSQTSGTNAGGAAGARVAVGGNASGSGGNASGSGGNASGSGGNASGSGGRSSVGGSSVGGAGAGGTATAMGGAAGSGGHKPGCPASFAEAFPFPVSGPTPLCTEQGATCELLIGCSSGAQLLSVTCKNSRWEVDALSCSKPYDFCPGMPGQNGSNVPGVYCKDKKWSVIDTRGQTIQPKPCPAQPPAEASICDQGGGDTLVYDHCGYLCPSDPTKWTVFACANPPNYLGHVAWFSDAACD
ncbi:MAG TPA: hypothetical protein VER96_29170 [Polyangiaceae bacterium]|nr:hypothetical protein [Polyangiaceae bacterium]